MERGELWVFWDRRRVDAVGSVVFDEAGAFDGAQGTQLNADFLCGVYGAVDDALYVDACEREVVVKCVVAYEVDKAVGLKADGKTIDVLSIYGVLVGIDEGVLEGDERGVFGKIFLGILGIEGSFEVIPAEFEIDGDVVFVFVRFKVADGELLGESR